MKQLKVGNNTGKLFISNLCEDPGGGGGWGEDMNGRQLMTSLLQWEKKWTWCSSILTNNSAASAVLSYIYVHVFHADFSVKR